MKLSVQSAPTGTVIMSCHPGGYLYPPSRFPVAAYRTACCDDSAWNASAFCWVPAPGTTTSMPVGARRGLVHVTPPSLDTTTMTD